MSQVPEQVRTYFERCAERFDGFYREEKKRPFERLVNVVFRRGLGRRFETTVGILGDVAGKRILDVGCGSGVYAIHFAKRGAEVTGIDFSAPMLALAEKNAAREGCRIRFMRGDFLEQRLDETFDYALFIGVFDYIEPAARIAYLKKAAALTRGKIVATFPKRYTPQAPIRLIWLRRQNCPVYFYTAGEIAGLARDAGLSAEFHNCGAIWTVALAAGGPTR
jgi:2-polyprenyl-3-methyl-5-hydroxy-6-metoxy-1,4-benzoquinol methylase